MPLEEFLFSDYYMPLYSRVAWRRRLCIFLIIGACAGVAALLWLFRVLWRHRKSGVRISVLMIILILTDLLELILDPYIVYKLVQDDTCWYTSMCWTLVSLWSAARHYGLHLNAVVALESVLSIRHPYCSAHVFFPSCSIVLSIMAFIGMLVLEYFIFYELYLLSVSLLLALTVITWIVTCRTPPHTDETSYSTRKPDNTVLGFVMLIIVPYMIYYGLCYILWRVWDLRVMGNCLMSLRVVSDPFLCMLVYWENLRQTPLIHRAQPSTEMTDDPETHRSAI